MSTDSDDEPTADELADKLSAAGRATITDRRDGADDTVDVYACPFCTYTEDSERMVRAHITTEDDAQHADRNGFLDQLYVHGLNEDGDIVEDVDAYQQSTRAGRDPGDETTALCGDDLTEKQQEIIRAVIRSPSLSTSQIQEQLARGEAPDAPSKSYIALTRDKYFTPSTTMDDDPDTTDDADTDAQVEDKRTGYSELTDAQQEVADRLAEFDDPFDAHSWPKTVGEVADELGYSNGLVHRVKREHADAVRHRHARKRAREERTTTTYPDTDADTDTDADVGADVGADVDESADTDTDTDTGARDDTLTVPKETMQQFERRLATIKSAAESQADVAPDGTAMQTHAQGKLEIVEETEDFLTEIAQKQE